MTSKPRPRLRGFDCTGKYRYSLTFCTFERRQWFVDASIVELVQWQIVRAATLERFAVIAYCYMPDHLHLLVESIDDTSDARRLLARIKQLSGYAFTRSKGQRLWQASGWDHVLRRDEDLGAIVRYVLLNPVRAGLVDEPLKYPFLGSGTYDLAALLEFAGLRPSP